MLATIQRGQLGKQSPTKRHCVETELTKGKTSWEHIMDRVQCADRKTRCFAFPLQTLHFKTKLDSLNHLESQIPCHPVESSYLYVPR